jgi:hypothetical protein
LLSKDSTLSPANADRVLEQSAVDLGPSGKDNAFGAGRIDVLAAITGVAEERQLTAYGSRLTAFPSPFKSVCRVNASAPVEVTDAMGRRVATVTGNAWRPGANVQPGVYFLRERLAVGGGRRAARVTYVR